MGTIFLLCAGTRLHWGRQSVKPTPALQRYPPLSGSPRSIFRTAASPFDFIFLSATKEGKLRAQQNLVRTSVWPTSQDPILTALLSEKKGGKKKARSNSYFPRKDPYNDGTLSSSTMQITTARGLLHSTCSLVHGRLMLLCGFLPRSLAAEIASCSDGAGHVSRTLRTISAATRCAFWE